MVCCNYLFLLNWNSIYLHYDMICTCLTFSKLLPQLLSLMKIGFVDNKNWYNTKLPLHCITHLHDKILLIWWVILTNTLNDYHTIRPSHIAQWSRYLQEMGILYFSFKYWICCIILTLAPWSHTWFITI